MKKTLLWVTLLLATSSLGWAGVCTSNPLTTYLAAGFTCTETMGTGTLTFSNFVYPTSENRLAAADVNVTALADGFGFTPTSGAWSVSTGGVLDATIIYTVTGDLDVIKLDLENFGRTNAGAILGVENIATTGGKFLGSQELRDNSRLNDCASQSNKRCVASLALPEVAGPFRIQKDLVLSADGVNSSAFIGTLSNQFDGIPEPGTMLLSGSGLLALGGCIRRRQRK